MQVTPPLLSARNEDDGPNLEEFDGSSTIRRRCAVGGRSAFALARPAQAVTEIQSVDVMTGANNDVVVKLANDFNVSQNDYKIVPSFKGQVMLMC